MRLGPFLPRRVEIWAWHEFTHEARLASVDEGFGREPFPHERAGRPVVDRVDQAADVVVDCIRSNVLVIHLPKIVSGVCTFELQLIRRPALL